MIQRQELFSPHPFPFPPQPQLFAHPLSQPHPQFVAVNSLIVKSSERFFDLQCYSMRRKRKCEMRNYFSDKDVKWQKLFEQPGKI